MISQFRRTVQVATLTFVLVFGMLLMIGGFEMPVWSDPHHGGTSYHKKHGTVMFFLYGGVTMEHAFYVNGGHGNTTHD